MTKLLPYENITINKEIITDKEIYIKIRTAQTKFRKKLIQKHKFCPITLVEEPKLLVASHIKPWALSTPKERIDMNNGFLFTPNIDKLFDIGLITFTEKKEMIFSPLISTQTIKTLNLERKIYKMLPIENKLKYLEFHRNKIFKEKI